LKQRRLEAAKKTGDELYEEEKCPDGGCFKFACGFCNAITWFFMHNAGTIPQIFGAWPNKLSVRQCFKSAENTGRLLKWGLRLLGWILLFAGVYALFSPLEVILDIIPFLGPYLGSGVSWILWAVCLMVTAVLATFIVSLAYMVYHPLMGMLYMVFTGCMVAAIGYGSTLIKSGH